MSVIHNGREIQYADASEAARRRLEPGRRGRVYNNLPALSVREGPTTPAVCAVADRLFDEVLAPALKGYKLGAKREYWRRLCRATMEADYKDGCVMHSRDKPNRIDLQVLDAAVHVGLLREVRSPKGSAKMSRYTPTDLLRKHLLRDPWAFDGRGPERLVFLRRRDDKEDLPFDPDDPTAADYRERLAVVNAMNSHCRITYTAAQGSGEDKPVRERERVLRPVHVAVFTDDFDHHGRIYTQGPYGHQSLSEGERATIRFDGEACVELDYQGMHPRLRYHLDGLDYAEDPYLFWGPATTGLQRLLAKVMLNALLNAETAGAAVSACRHKLRLKTGGGEWKSGKGLDKAIELNKAVKDTGLSFQDVYAAALRKHPALRRWFGADAGMTLMREDGAIALDVLHHFARRCTPILCCHDSFVVPRSAERPLRRRMLSCYKNRVGFLPVVTGGEG